MSFVDPAALSADSAAPADTQLLAPDCSTAAASLRLHPLADPDRGRVQRFIAGVYLRHFEARPPSFMPRLVSVQANGRICAAAGYRSARESLFLERYLPQPIERMLSAAAGSRIRREHIVEVGHFASARAGEGRRLMASLGRHLADRGFRWVALTATAELRVILRRLGLTPLTLIDADPARLGADAAVWGSYYAHAPQVLAGDLVAALARFDGSERT